MTEKILIIVLFVMCAVFAVIYARYHSQQKSIEILFDTLSRHTKVFAELQGSLEETKERLASAEKELHTFKSKFTEVMAEAERQNEREAQWNEGLNNILNYSLTQAFDPGGKKK